MRVLDYLIIGGGIIGLGLAKALKTRYPDASVVLIEKERAVGMHSSGRNSGVLHAGFYYTANSLKARFTREGNAAMHVFCEANGLAINRCGKVVVAQNAEELEGLKELKRRGDANGVALEWMSEEELWARFPEAKTFQKALFSPTTSTVNPKEVVKALALHVKALGVEIRTQCAYEARLGNDAILTSQGPLFFKTLINAAGLYRTPSPKSLAQARRMSSSPLRASISKTPTTAWGFQRTFIPCPIWPILS